LGFALICVSLTRMPDTLVLPFSKLSIVFNRTQGSLVDEIFPTMIPLDTVEEGKKPAVFVIRPQVLKIFDNFFTSCRPKQF
jgi:hypothetical protein